MPPLESAAAPSAASVQVEAAASVSPEAAASRRLVVMHDTFRDGVDGWHPSAKTRLKRVRSQSGADAMRLKAKKGRSVKKAVRAGSQIVGRGAPAGEAYTVRTKVRVRQPSAVVRVRIREVRRGVTVAQRQTKVRVSKAWRKISVKHRKKRANTQLRVQVKASFNGGRRVLLVDNVRATVRPAEVSRSADDRARECTISTRGIPSCGAFFGASVGLNRDATSLERAAGGTLGVHRTFYQASQVDRAVSVAAADLRAGRLPWISFKLPHSWAEMADGRGDAWAEDIAKRLAKLPGPVWVAFHHEPELDGPIEQWVRVQERLAPVVRKQAPNVAYTVILMGWHQFYGVDDTYSLDKIVPKKHIDIVGFDLYNYFGTPGSNRTENANLKEQYFNKISRWAKRRGVEWAIGEIGYTDRALATEPKWLLKTYRQMVATGGIAMSYFNSAPANATGDWLLDTPDRVAAFAEVQQESLHLS